jgi:DNA-binding XRE family transcriptional regulator
MTDRLVEFDGHRVSGPELRAVRKAEGVSIADMAKLLEVSQKTIYNMEKAAELRGPYRWAAYTLFPQLRPSVVAVETV